MPHAHTRKSIIMIARIILFAKIYAQSTNKNEKN